MASVTGDMTRGTAEGGKDRLPPPGSRAIVASTFRSVLPVVLAQATGAFRWAGLEVRIAAAHSSDDQLAQLMSGAIDVAHTALDNVVAWSATAPVRVVGVIDLGLAHELVARDPVSAVDGLRGAVIGVDSPANGLVVLLRSMLREAGIDDGTYTLCAAGGLVERAKAFEAGELDACLLAGAALERARAAGHHRLLALRDRFPHYPALAIIARSPIVGRRRDELTRYVGALHAATRTTDDTAATLASAAELLGTTAAGAATWLRAERARTTGIVDGRLPARQVIADALAVTDRLAAGEAVDPFVDLLMDDGPAAPRLYTFSRSRRENG